MGISEFLKAAAEASEALEKMVPLAQSLGAPAVLGQVAATASGLLEVAQNVKARIDERELIASVDDEAAALAIVKQLQTTNDRLAVYIAAS